MVITDSHRFTAIFIFGALLISGSFALYATRAEGEEGEQISKDIGVFESTEYGFRVTYPNNLTSLPQEKTEHTPFDVEFVGREEQQAVLRIAAEPKRAVTPCAKINGRVSGIVVIGTSTYQLCRITTTGEEAVDRARVETSHGVYTYVFTIENYTVNAAIAQTVLSTFQFVK